MEQPTNDELLQANWEVNSERERTQKQTPCHFRCVGWQQGSIRQRFRLQSDFVFVCAYVEEREANFCESGV